MDRSTSKKTPNKVKPGQKINKPNGKKKVNLKKEKVTKKASITFVKSGPSKQALFKPNTKDDNGYQCADKITHAGWINDPLKLGLLKNIKNGENAVVFEFELNKIKLDAWSGKKKGWGQKNMQQLKVGHSYVLQGTMRAKQKSAKFSRSSNSTFRFEINLAGVKVIEEKRQDGQQTSSKTSLVELNQLITSGKSFNKSLEQVEIVSGEVRRYMGCEDCYAGLSKPDSNGKYYCKLCNSKTKSKRIKKRRVCLIIRNLKLKDKSGFLENAVCYQRQCQILFGNAEEVEKLCKSSSDLDARNKFNELIGTKLKAVSIKHQAPTGSQKKAFNVFKLIIEDIIIGKKVDPKEPTKIQISNQSDPSLITRHTAPPANSHCFCELEADEDDNEDHVSSTTSPASSPGPSKKMKTDSFFIDTDGQYELIETNEGFIGLAIIINMNFSPVGNSAPKAGMLLPRRGSEHNVKRLEYLLPKHGIRVFKGKTIEDVDRKQFDKEMKEFKEELINKNYSSSLVILMSHGSLYTVRLSGKTNDSFLNVYKDILPEFGERSFSEFCGKPKIFIFNACQTFGESRETKIDDTQLIPDVLECYPCTPGIKSKRSTVKGSYFLDIFCDVLEEYSETMHIEEIMKEVQKRMSEKRLGKDKKSINIPVYKPMLFSKRFYFKKTSVIKY